MASTLALRSSASAFVAAPLVTQRNVSHSRSVACKVSCSAEQVPLSKRLGVSVAAAAAVAFLAAGPVIEPAQAKDVPLFGIKKKAAKAVENAQNAAESAQNAVENASGSLFGGFSAPKVKVSTPEDKLTKAGAVVAADVVALLVASSVVGGLLKPSS